jgi:hypothetical protein
MLGFYTLLVSPKRLPLTCNAAGLGNVDKVVLIREMGGARAPSPDAPSIVWALYHQNRHLMMLGTNLERSDRPLPEVIGNGD